MTNPRIQYLPRNSALDPGAWTLLFVEHVSDQSLIIPAMDTVAGGVARLFESARLIPGWEESARRLVDILIAGSRAKASAADTRR